MKKILLILLLIAAVGGGIGYYQWNRPMQSSADQKAALAISALDLEKAYTNNEENANTTYNDKIIEVTGKVSQISKETDKTSVFLETSNPMASINCEFEKTANTSNIKIGDNVSIKGKPTGILSDVVLVQCVLNQK